SEEHTSELQSREKLVCRLLLKKKRTITTIQANDLIDRMWGSICSLDNSTGQISIENVSNIKTQWEGRWKVIGNTSDFINGLTSEQLALHNRMGGWSGKLDIVDAAKRRYKITIEWENRKAKWYEANTANKESFIYNFSVPKCEV